MIVFFICIMVDVSVVLDAFWAAVTLIPEILSMWKRVLWNSGPFSFSVFWMDFRVEIEHKIIAKSMEKRLKNQSKNESKS